MGGKWKRHRTVTNPARVSSVTVTNYEVMEHTSALGREIKGLGSSGKK